MKHKVKNIHFVGIGGAGMSPLAKVLVELSYEVSGSDRTDSDVIEKLRKLGAKITLGGQKAENVRGVDAIVVSTAIPYDNPEVLAARDLGIMKLHRSDINAALVNQYKGIAVAGAHGKTTTTSMLGVVLTKAGISPTVVVGGEVPDLGTNALLGEGEYLTSEADESDGSFLKLHPHIAVVTNVEDDHMDHYGTMENIIKAFTQFIQNVDKETGYAVLCFDNENLRNMSKIIDRKFYSYAIDHEADYQARNITTGGKGIAFDVVRGTEELGHVSLNIPGRHNVLDAMACIVTGLSIGVPFEKIAAGLSAFHGAKRRFQTKGRAGGVWVVDDYAHHPTEIEATLHAAKNYPHKKIWCVFQPHTYTRTKALLPEFAKALTLADHVVLADIYAARETDNLGISSRNLQEKIVELGTPCEYFPTFDEIENFLLENCTQGDLLITMGAGDVVNIGEHLLGK